MTAPALAVFDLDGTLLDTGVTATDRCFVPVFHEVFGPIQLSEEWASYPEATSAGILHEVSRRHRGRPPTDAETKDVQTRLDRAMRAAFLGGGERIALTKGAIAILARLRADPGWRLAVATGNWAHEAAVKLESAGLDLDALPTATADDRVVRREILPLAVQRACAAYGVPTWRSVVYVGDGIWDVAACRANGIRFLGIGAGDRAKKLRDAGAADILPDFSDVDAVLEKLEAARIP